MHPSSLLSTHAAAVALVLALVGCHETDPTGPAVADVGPVTPPTAQPKHHLAFAGFAKGQTQAQIYAVAEGSPFLLPLTHFSHGGLTYGQGQMAWSPTLPGGGSKIAFVYQPDTHVHWLHLYIMNADGSAQHDLLPSGAYGLSVDPGWSPNGSKLAFEQSSMDLTSTLSVVNSDGSGLIELARHRFQADYAWSPDGAKLAFRHSSVSGGAETLSVVNADGSNLVHIARNAGLSNAVWAPDGTYLTFATWKDDPATPANERGLFRVHPDGSSQTRLRNEPSGTTWYDMSSSPDGSRLIAQEAPGYGILLMNSDGTGATRMPLCDQSLCYNASWFPDGSHFLMKADVELWSFDAQGGNAVSLLDSNAVTAVLSRDGARIAYTANNHDLYMMHSDGSSKTRITYGMSLNDLTWGP